MCYPFRHPADTHVLNNIYTKFNRLWATILPRTFPTTWAQYVHQKIVALNTDVISRKGYFGDHKKKRTGIMLLTIPREGTFASLLVLRPPRASWHPLYIHSKGEYQNDPVSFRKG